MQFIVMLFLKGWILRFLLLFLLQNLSCGMIASSLRRATSKVEEILNRARSRRYVDFAQVLVANPAKNTEHATSVPDPVCKKRLW